MPGHESMRSSNDPSGSINNFDKNYLYLVELCQAVAAYKEITISDHQFVPREFLYQHLERHLLSILMNFLKSVSTTEFSNAPNLDFPKRPSEILAFLNAQIALLQKVDICCEFFSFFFEILYFFKWLLILHGYLMMHYYNKLKD